MLQLAHPEGYIGALGGDMALQAVVSILDCLVPLSLL
jgi:hypothetical protein